jgi:Rhodopirellula transposase DDE domain
MRDAAVIKRLESMYNVLRPMMDERLRRQWAVAEAQAYGWGGVRAVSAATGMSANTVRRGLQELSEREANPGRAIVARVRRAGGGRKPQTELDPGLVNALERLIDPVTRGDPGTPLRWTCKSTTHLADELSALGCSRSAWRVAGAQHAIRHAAPFADRGRRPTSCHERQMSYNVPVVPIACAAI